MTREVEWCFCLPQHCAELGVYAHVFFTLRLHVFLSRRLHVFSCFGGMQGIMNACETKGAVFFICLKTEPKSVFIVCLFSCFGGTGALTKRVQKQAGMHAR